MRLLPVTCLGLLLTWPALAEGTAVPVDLRSCGGPAKLDRLSAVSSLGDLGFGSGSTGYLAGIRLADGPPWRDAALGWLRERIGRGVGVTQVSDPDRWERMPVRVLDGEEHGQADWAQSLVERGLAMADPGAGGLACGAHLLSIESVARQQGLGLWTDDRYKAISVTQTERLRERIGRFALVEGRIRSVGERRERTYVNFGPDWASDFTIVIPKRVWGLMLKQGLTAAALRHRAIRARGIVEDWQGPALTLTMPEAMELLGDENRRR